MAASRRKSKWDVTVSSDNSRSTNVSATDAARERAAKLNAMLAAQGKLAKGTPPPPMIPPSTVQPLSIGPPKSLNNGPGANSSQNQDLFSAEVEINDSPARVILCRGITQDEINHYSGAAVSTKGQFMSEKEKNEIEGTGARPLYLSIQGLTQQKVDLAVKRIREIMNGADIYGNLPANHMPVQPPRMPVPPHMATPTLNQPPPVFDRQPLPPGMHYVQDKVFVGLDNAIPEFSVKEKLVGPGGSYFQHIATQTGAKVQLRGKGSGFIEPTSGKEAFEALYIYISHGRVDGLSAAKKLVENLLETIHTEYKAFEQTRRSHHGYSPYTNAGHQVNIGHPPSGYQPPSYGYPHLPAPAGSYQQPAPAPGYHSYPHATGGQLPPQPPHPAVPRPHPPYGYTPPAAGYPTHQPPMPPPNHGPAPYHSHPPNAHYQGMAPHGPALPSVSQPAGQLPPHMPPQPPLLPTGPPVHDRGEDASSSAEARTFESLPPPQEPTRRKFTEKVPVKTAVSESANGVKHQESSILNPSIGEASVTGRENEKKTMHFMPPPPALPISRAKTSKERDSAPLQAPRRETMQPPASAPVHSRARGKRDAPTLSQPAVAAKKPKAAEKPEVASSAIASLVAYGGGDSSDEEGSQSPDDKEEATLKKENKSSWQFKGAKLPFWAVRH